MEEVGSGWNPAMQWEHTAMLVSLFKGQSLMKCVVPAQ
jgi:hypothetical protein